MAGERDDADLTERRRIDDEYARAVVFVGVDALEFGIVGDCIDRTVDGNRAQNGLRDRIDLAHRTSAAVSGKDVAVAGIDRDARHRTDVDDAERLAGVGVGDQ